LLDGVLPQIRGSILDADHPLGGQSSTPIYSQVIVGLALTCRSAYRGVVEFLRDLLGLPVSLGCVHDVLQAATRQADIINRQQTCQALGGLA